MRWTTLPGILRCAWDSVSCRLFHSPELVVMKLGGGVRDMASDWPELLVIWLASLNIDCGCLNYNGFWVNFNASWDFQTDNPLAQPQWQANACHCDCARRLWKSLQKLQEAQRICSKVSYQSSLKPQIKKFIKMSMWNVKEVGKKNSVV